MGRTSLDTPARQQEVFAAVLHVFADVGYARFNMDLVASLYRRWPSKARLIVDALKANMPVQAQPRLREEHVDRTCTEQLRVAVERAKARGELLRPLIGWSFASEPLVTA